MSTQASAPSLVVRTTEGERSLAAGRVYLVGRDPQADIVVPDFRVSWHHAELRPARGRWALADLASGNGSYADGRRADLIEIDGTRQIRLGDPEDGPLLDCTLLTRTAGQARSIGRVPDNDIMVPHPSVSRHHAELHTTPDGYRIVDLGSHNGTFVNEQRVSVATLAEGDTIGFGDTTFRLSGGELFQIADPAPAQMPPAPDLVAEPAAELAADSIAESGIGAAAGASPGPAEANTQLAEIPYAVRWLAPRGERFANFDILNDNDTQLDYYRRFGHIYAVGIPARKWRLVVVSDPELLDQVAADEEQFGKRVEEINFFTQLANSRGGGLSVIGDGPHYERIRRVMLPWYSPAHQRTQLDRMKDQAGRLVAAWAALPDDEPLDARAWMERYTLEVSGRGACAYDFGLLASDATSDGTSDRRPHPFAAAVPASTKESILRVADPRPDFTLFAGRSRRARRKEYRRHNKELFRTADALVRARMHTCPLGTQTDLLSRLVSTPDPETGEFLDAETIRDQILMHLSNGFNGPSITAAWLAYVLATNPDVEEKLIAEIDGITGGDPGYDLRYDDLLALPYTTAVIKETMRIYPPMPVTIRRSLKDGTLGRYRIRKGDIILVGTLAAQRDSRYWGPEPDRFDPEQFTMDKIAGRPRHAFIPFSIGKRQCMAQEVTFMMLRVVLFEVYRRYRLRLAPGATVVKNAVVTTKPAAVPVIRVPREVSRPRPSARPSEGAIEASGAIEPAGMAIEPDRSAAVKDGWGQPTEIPPASAYRHLVIAYGSNFGASKELAERFAERSDFYGYTSEVLTLNQLADTAPRTEPWLLVIMTSTYTSNPPSNATAFRTWLDRTAPDTGTWRNCRYLVWGLGNSQWNAFLAFPRYVQQKLADLGATPLADLGFGDVGSPVWERLHADWNSTVWPVLLELSGAKPTADAAKRVAAGNAATGALTDTDSTTAMHRSLYGGTESDEAGEAAGATRPMPRPASATSIMRQFAADGTASRVMLAPAILTNGVGVRTAEARVLASQELQPCDGPKRTRQLDISLPPGVTYRAGDHLGVCPKNDEERVERLAGYLGAALDGLFMAPKTLNAHAVPKGVVLQVRNVLTSLVDISSLPSVPLLDLLVAKAASPAERARLTEIRNVLAHPGGPDSPLRAAIEAGGYDVLRLLDEFPSCSLNIFEFLRVAQPLRPRYYSASSSPRVHGEGVIQVTAGLETTPVPGGHPFRGLGSSYLHALRPGDRLNVFLDSADGFRLQQDVTRPMIFVSAGTGLAPMRGFCWERLAMQRSGVMLAEAALFNGIRSASQDYIYRDEIARFEAEGVLSHVHVAMSREQPGHREYVQDRIRAQGALVWRLLGAGGYVYVCGAQPMRDAVRTAFADVIAEHGRLPRDRAEAYLDELETTARYRPDLWG
jgi:cytochrome P450/NADPH-cytochrome P450 reductase